MRSLVTARDRKTHDNRRRIWDQGFSTTGQKRFLMQSVYAEEVYSPDPIQGVSVGVR